MTWLLLVFLSYPLPPRVELPRAEFFVIGGVNPRRRWQS